MKIQTLGSQRYSREASCFKVAGFLDAGACINRNSWGDFYTTIAGTFEFPRVVGLAMAKEINEISATFACPSTPTYDAARCHDCTSRLNSIESFKRVSRL